MRCTQCDAQKLTSRVESPAQLDIWAPKPVILAGGYNAEDAFRLTAQHPNVAIAFGRYFISNVSSDLVTEVVGHL